MAGYLMPGATEAILHVGAVDTVNRKCSGTFSDGSECGNVVDTSYPVGGAQITPSVGEIWKISRIGPSTWRLIEPMPKHLESLSGTTTPQEGQSQYGGRGPTELLGSEINAHAPLRPLVVDTLPDATTAGEGAGVYYRAQHKPVWSDGTTWRDAAGMAVS